MRIKQTLAQRRARTKKRQKKLQEKVRCERCLGWDALARMNYAPFLHGYLHAYQSCRQPGGAR